MTYPLNKQEFVDKWLSVLDDPDNGDRAQAIATVQAINKAYYAGMAEGICARKK